MTERKAIKRSKIAEFINVGTKETQKWARIGHGVAENTISYNANVVTETFIHQDNASNSVDSYAPQIPVTQYAYKGDEVFDYVDKLRKNRATGTECETQLLIVYVYDTEDNTSYGAELNDIAIQVDSYGGAGGERAQIAYNILFNGDPTQGTATLKDGTPTFTASN